MDRLIEVMNQDGYSKEFINELLIIANNIIKELKESD